MLALSLTDIYAQQATNTSTATNKSEQFSALKWRNIGPFRGGRSNAVCGVIDDPLTYYFGSVGGGIWKTTDAGISWKNISDGQLKTGSVGAIAVAKADPNVIYVGMGEHAVRGVMTSHGDGMYKSTDAGKTWTHIGLPYSRHIAEIRIHPENPDVVYVAVQGALHKYDEHRGIYKSTDGGANWEKVFYINEKTGAADLSIDPDNPRILYAGMWENIRYPWQVVSGGEGSGLYKSTDGGTTWQELSKGLPDMMGKVAVDVSPANSNILYANIEAEGEKGGVYRSDDGGNSWRQTCKERVTIARAWYYTEVFADPQDPETVYVLNAPMLKSVDGGKTFKSISNPHTDQHHLWINPNNTDNIILANDGGACITFNGGDSWSSQKNQPTAQFYRVIADNQFPYFIYGGQQDNSTVAIPSRTAGSSINWKDWYAVAGGESAFIAFDPEDPRYVYGGSYQGNISVFDHQSGMTKDIMAYPIVGLGWTPSEMKYRFNWNAPIVTSPQNRSVIYHGANVVLQSMDRGQTWKAISPDLTRNEKDKQGLGGVPFTNEGAGGENYNTISYMVASYKQGELWVGSDDGLIHLTQDDGQTWKNITPKGLDESLINAIEVSPHDPATAYVAITKYKFGDFTPMIYITNNYGKSWKNKVNGIADDDYVRVVREDPQQKGLLYAGTETGLYVSFDDGDNWEKFQLNLPVCPILDLYIQDNDLIAATSGRAFWILDDLGAIQQTKGNLPNEMAIYEPKPTYRFNFNTPGRAPQNEGQNAANGVIFDYSFPEDMDSTTVTLEVLNDKNEIIRTYSNQKKKVASGPGQPAAPRLLPTQKGLNRFNWDLKSEGIPGVPGVFMLGSYDGSAVPPGEYTLRLTANDQSVSTTALVLPNPDIEATMADYQEQAAIMRTIENTVRSLHNSVNEMRKVKKRLKTVQEMLDDMEEAEELKKQAQEIVDKITQWEENLIQPRQKTFQDVINFPNRLNAEMMNLRSRIDGAIPQVTQGARQRLEELAKEWSGYEKQMKELINKDVKAFNEAYREKAVPAVITPKVNEATGS